MDWFQYPISHRKYSFNYTREAFVASTMKLFESVWLSALAPKAFDQAEASTNFVDSSHGNVSFFKRNFSALRDRLEMKLVRSVTAIWLREMSR